VSNQLYVCSQSCLCRGAAACKRRNIKHTGYIED